jgi:hypothetical protein
MASLPHFLNPISSNSRTQPIKQFTESHHYHHHKSWHLSVNSSTFVYLQFLKSQIHQQSPQLIMTKTTNPIRGLLHNHQITNSFTTSSNPCSQNQNPSPAHLCCEGNEEPDEKREKHGEQLKKLSHRTC